MPPAEGYRPDPGGNFASDVHRRVAAHLHSEEEGMGWVPLGLLGRLAEDHATPLPPLTEAGVPDYVAGMDELEAVLADLKADKLAESAGGTWRLTDAGFDLLTGPIANEPEPGAPVEGPAIIDLGPVPFGGKASAKGGVKT